MLLDWNDRFSVGIDIMDDQHKQLFEMINNFHNSFVNGNSNQSIVSLIGEMKKYALLHFTSEEKIMEQKGFPYLKKHKLMHKDFVDKVQSLEENIESGQNVNPTEIVKYLNEWIINHIQFEDKLYGSYFETNKLL